MKKGIDCFVAFADFDTTLITLKQLKEEPLVNNIYLLMTDDTPCPYPNCKVLRIDSIYSSDTVKQISAALGSPYAMVCMKQTPVIFGYKAIQRWYNVAEGVDAAVVYADHYAVKDGETVNCPTMDFYYGSVRDDFDFGSVTLHSANALRTYVYSNPDANYKYSGWYDLQLFDLRRKRSASLFHLREYLYTEEELDTRKSGEKQFDYVDPRNRDAQLEKEQVCTEHLKIIGAYIDPASIVDVSVERSEFTVEASVIIPVRNRVKTIEDAIMSALSQKTSFEFNVIVVDNLSTDGTSAVIERIAQTDSRVIHIVPTRKDLGIGGCWSLAFNSEQCGRFSVQLDSDDLYSGPDTLQTIVDKFYEEHCGMVIGSYRMCNFQLETLPPGLIDHKEWTEENGRNNALRINGLGAPRAFFTPLLRKIGMPNTSYGEDYAVGLAFSRKYKIGRIYTELYLCRRWEGNSDAALKPEQVNRNNVYKDSLRTMEIIDRRRLNEYWSCGVTKEDAQLLFDEQMKQWPETEERYRQLKEAVTKSLNSESYRLAAQFNPGRIASTGAKIDTASIEKRPCFLCDVNRPVRQVNYPMLKKYHLLVNPYPILPQHYTIPLRHHKHQEIKGNYRDMMEIAQTFDNLIVFYNGPYCGASAPDHMHFQAGSRGVVPLERDWSELYRFTRSRLWPISEDEYIEAQGLEEMADNTGIFSLRGYACPGVVIITRTPEANEKLFMKIYDALPVPEGHYEPMMNILAFTQSSSLDGSPRIVSVVIPRTKHRPDCYYKEGGEQMLVSPGALDMCGFIITPREDDYNRIDLNMATDIIRECAMSLDDELEMIMKFKLGK